MNSQRVVGNQVCLSGYLVRRPALRLTIVIVLCALGFALAGCTRAPNTPPQAPTTVSVSYPVQKQVRYFTEFTGRTAAVDSVDVRASHISGYLDNIRFKEGKIVKKGDILCEIDPRPYKALVSQAKANLESTIALEVQKLAVYKRTEALVRDKAASKEDLDNARGDWGVAKANIDVAKANLDTAELNLNYTKVRAEITGRIGKYNVTVGNFIQSGDQGGGTLLTTIVSVDPIYAYFDVDERTVLHVKEMIRRGKVKSARDDESRWPVSLGLASENGFPHDGQINFVDNKVNTSTGTLQLRGEFPNKDDALVPGFFVRVRVPVGELYDAILISDRAIDSDQGQKIVYVVDSKNEVVVRPVELGALHDGLREIVSGLKKDERVIVNGLQQVRPGAVVEPKMVEMPLNPAFKPGAQAAK